MSHILNKVLTPLQVNSVEAAAAMGRLFELMRETGSEEGVDGLLDGIDKDENLLASLKKAQNMSQEELQTAARLFNEHEAQLFEDREASSRAG